MTYFLLFSSVCLYYCRKVQKTRAISYMSQTSGFIIKNKQRPLLRSMLLVIKKSHRNGGSLCLWSSSPPINRKKDTIFWWCHKDCILRRFTTWTCFYDHSGHPRCRYQPRAFFISKTMTYTVHVVKCVIYIVL